MAVFDFRRQACHSRALAVNVIKLFVMNVILKCDFKLANGEVADTIMFRSLTTASSMAKVEVRRTELNGNILRWLDCNLRPRLRLTCSSQLSCYNCRG